VGVTIMIVLMWIQAILGMVSGVVFLLLRHNATLRHQTKWGTNTFTAVAIVAIVIAALTALLAYLLGRGSNAVRWLVGIVSALEVAGSVYALARFAGTTRTNAIITLVIGLAVLYILFAERGSKEFFST
jgi:uncharacterized membrane protein